jgi:MFS family permease
MPTDIAMTIQLALAPAFLLVGIGQFLILAAGRLGRIVDRARVLADILPTEPGPEHEGCVRELRLLDRRMNVMSLSILFGTMAMIAVCLVVAGLFATRLLGVSLTGLTAGTFVGAMGLLILGLVTFLYEIRLANQSIHVRSDLISRSRK